MSDGAADGKGGKAGEAADLEAGKGGAAAGADGAAPAPVAPPAGASADAGTAGAIANGTSADAAGAADGKATGENGVAGDAAAGAADKSGENGVAGDGKGTSMQAEGGDKQVKKKKKKKKEEEEEESDDEPDVQPKLTLRQRFCPCLPQRGDNYAQMRNLGGGGGDSDSIIRPWEFTFSMFGVQNVLNDPITCFFCVKINPENPKKHKNKVHLLPQYTEQIHLRKGQDWKPSQPVTIYLRERFFLSYKELKKHQLQLDMWEVHKLSFNYYHGTTARPLFSAATRPSEQVFFVRKKQSPKEEAKKNKGSGAVMDVALFRSDCRIEEVFDFKLSCENFSLEYEPENPKFKKWQHQDAKIQFIMPRNPRSYAHRARTCTRQGWPFWSGPERFLWSKPIDFFFTGTRKQLSSSFFIVNVYSQKKSFEKQPPTTQIGKALMGLTSILDISVFKGTIKHLSTKRNEFIVGKLHGNIRLEFRSLGEPDFHREMPLNSPIQRVDSSNVTGLSKDEQYLVIRVDKCLNLPIADLSTCTSDPYLRVMWDEMVYSSNVIRATVRPVFKQLFFFPVRLFSPKLVERRYQENAFRYEIEDKGPIKITVWDKDPNGSSDLLGLTEVSMFDLVNSPFNDFRSLKGKLKKDKGDGEDDEFVKPNKPQWYDRELTTRIFDGMSEGGIQLRGWRGGGNQETPLIFFEAYFWPDFDENLRVHEGSAAKKLDELWRIKEKNYMKESVEFAMNYKQAFPDSIGALPPKEENQFGMRNLDCRRFMGCMKTIEYGDKPLMAWICKIIVPGKYSCAPLLLHWMNCFTFHIDSRQQRNGLVNSINDVQTLLFSRKGSVQDHAVLLCSILRGTSRDAYVVKGTVWAVDEDPVQKSRKEKGKSKIQEDVRHRLVEHYWVMSREKDDWITFWEPCTRDVYHMPARWSYSKAQKRKQDKEAKKLGLVPVGQAEEEKPKEELAEIDEKEIWEYEVPDKTLGTDDIDQLPTIGRTPKAKAKVRTGPNPRDIAKAKLMQQRERLIIAPKTNLLVEDNLVDWLPYDSIEFVFNEENVYCNRQNHHPACITYDLDEQAEKRWSPMLKSDEEKKEHRIEYITRDVVQDPACTPSMVKSEEQKTILEMQENMRLYRGNHGLSCEFDKDRRMPGYCRDYLTILEGLRSLDKDFCPIWQKKQSEWTEAEKYIFKLLDEKPTLNRHGSAFSADSVYLGQQEDGWQELMYQVEAFIAQKLDFPFRRGKQFDGFAIHFSTSEPDEMRKYLMLLDDYRKLIDCDDADDLNFVVHCEMWALLNGILSVWLYFGCHCPVDAIKKKKKKGKKSAGMAEA